MKLSELREASFNPRVMSASQIEILKENIANLGDLGGIVFNRRTGNLVGGHQRVKALKETAPETEVVLEEQLAEPNEQGTVARGYILHDGEKFSYREVDWDQQTEKIANVAANNVHGGWDVSKLTDLIQGLASEVGDITGLHATGFSQEALDAIVKGSPSLEHILRKEDIGKLGFEFPKDILDPAVPETVLSESLLDEREIDESIPTANTCPKCGYKFS